MDKRQKPPASNICTNCNSDRALGGKALKAGECNVCLAVEDMWQAVGDVLVRHFPEDKWGDVSPLVAVTLHNAHEGLAKEWVWANVPGADHEDA